MNNELWNELEKLRPETREQMIVTNSTWMRLRKLEQEYSQLEIRRETLLREINVVKDDP